MTSTPSLPAQIEAVRAAIARREQQTEDWSATESEIPKLMAVLVTLQQHERTVSERDTAQTICGEAYQAVGALAHYMGLSDHSDIIRLLDNLAYHDDPPHETLLPWPKEDLPNIRQQHERLEAALRSAPVMSMYHGHRGFEVERFIADYETWRKQCRAALDAAAPSEGLSRSDHSERLEAALREPSNAVLLAAAKACCCPSGRCAADYPAPAQYCQRGKYLAGMRAALRAALDTAAPDKPEDSERGLRRDG